MAWIRDFTVFEQLTASTNPASDVVFPIHAVNDVLLLYMACDGTNTPALPGGWTNIDNQAGTAQTFRLCYKVAASAAEVCPTLSLSAGDEWHITVIAVANADYADPINFNGKRTATDSSTPFTWTSGLSTDENNVLIFQFCNSDTGLALTARPPFVNLQCGDAGSAGGSVAYTFQPTAGAIVDAVWLGRSSDDTTANAVGINDDGNGTRPGYAAPSTVGSFISPFSGLGTDGDTNPGTLTFGGIGQRHITQGWRFDGTSTWTDKTTDMANYTASDNTLANAVNGALYFGYDYDFLSMLVYVGTAQSGGTVAWEYWNGSSWTSAGVTAVLTATGFVRVAFGTRTGWTTCDVNGVTKYYVRLRCTATFTAAPSLSFVFVGCRLTTFDAVANAGDAGVNPYNDAVSLTPAITANFSGSERQFGAARDMDTGIVILHHKSQLPRDYAVDPTINDQAYPVTQILGSRAGFLIVFADANNYYQGFSIHGKGAISNSTVDWNVAAIGINNGAQAFSDIGTLNKSAITRMLLLPQGENGAMSAYMSGLSLVQEIVIAGGDDGSPMGWDGPAGLKWVVNNCVGINLLFNGIGTYYRLYAPLQLGGDGQTYIVIDGITFAMPTKFDGKKYFDWNADDNVAGWEFYGTSSADKFGFTNCIFVGTQPYRWEFNSSHSASAVLDFAGSTVDGATVTLRSTVTLSSVKFKNCPTFTLNGADLSLCNFINTKVAAASPADAAGISDCTFTKTAGTQHAIEISGTAANFTLDGCQFTGYAASDGSTGNEAIYVNIASGTVQISITGGGSTPSIRTAGATVTVVNARNLTLSPIITGSDVVIYAAGTTTVIESSQDIAGTSYVYDYPAADAGDFIDIGIFKIGYVPFLIRNYELSTSDASVPVSQVVDRFYIA